MSQAIVGPGKVVTIHYTLTDDAGKELDRSGDEPMDYLHGAENVVLGLEKQLEGRAVGDKLRAVVKPEEGYGKRLPGSQTLPLAAFPDDAEIEVGTQFAAEGEDGEPVPVWVVSVSPTEVEIDRNHPLAGVTLTFDVEVLAVRDATKDELAHGHPHGPDGHHHD